LPVPMNPIFICFLCSLEMRGASFETRPLGAPQDDGFLGMPSKEPRYPEERRGDAGTRLEGRKLPVQRHEIT
jgi:hypothetical protein